MYYDETNSHPLDADVFFTNVPTSTQLMELDGEEAIYIYIYIFCIDTNKNKYLSWVEGDNQFFYEGDESSPKDRFKSVVATRKSMPFTLTIQ